MQSLIGALAVLAFAVNANAVITTFDNFDYADGSLAGNGGWTGHSGNAGDLLVASNQAVVQHGVPSEDAHVAFTAVAGSIYYGLDFSVDDLGHVYAGSDNEYFAHFSDGGTFNFRGRLDVVPGTGGGDYTVGIATNDSTADAIWATDLTFGTTYRAVVRYDQDFNKSTLWIDATLSTDTSIAGTNQSNPGDSILWMALRQSDSSENETVRVDNLVVGTKFGSVFQAVPEPASLSLLALGALAVLRRRR